MQVEEGGGKRRPLRLLFSHSFFLFFFWGLHEACIQAVK